MKREVELQSMVVKAMNANGGRAFKTSHRFMTGVVDLFVKLPPAASGKFNPPGGFIEAKQRSMTASSPEFIVDISPAQNRFLKEMHDAGCPTGVMSFVQRGAGANWTCFMAVRVWKGDGTEVPFRLASYVEISHMPERERNNVILTALHDWMENWRRLG